MKLKVARWTVRLGIIALAGLGMLLMITSWMKYRYGAAAAETVNWPIYTWAVAVSLLGMNLLGRDTPRQDVAEHNVVVGESKFTNHAFLMERDLFGAYLIGASLACIGFRLLFQFIAR